MFVQHNYHQRGVNDYINLNRTRIDHRDYHTVGDLDARADSADDYDSPTDAGSCGQHCCSR